MVKIKEMFEIYERAKDDMKFLITSDVRSKILISLNEGSKNLENLRNEIHLSSSTILHGMNQLKQKDIVVKESGNYSLSQTGKMAAIIFEDFMKALSSLSTCKNLFLNHETKCIPNSLIKDIGCLNDAVLIKSTTTDVLRPHTVLSDLLSTTRNVKHLSSVFYPQNVELFLRNLEERGNVDIIFTREVLDKLVGFLDHVELENWISSGKLKLGCVNDSMKIFLTVGDDFMAMGLFSAEGNYDLNLFLISKGEEAISWGNRLFNHYLRHAKRFET